MNNSIRLPEGIRKLTEGKKYQENKVGMSKASVRIFDDSVLKIDSYRKENDETVKVMRWLSGKIPVPEVIAYESDDEYQYLLMSRVKGKMACDKYYMSRPELLVEKLAEAMKMLWSVDVYDCPRERKLEDELKEARYRIENNLVNMDNAEPSTFGEGGFKNPEELLNWLEENKPEYEPVLSHGDFCLPNIFLEGDEIRGFIDLGDMAIGGKWKDIALCYRSLRWNAEGTYGGDVYPDVESMKLFDALGIEPNMNKIRYYILLDELF